MSLSARKHKRRLYARGIPVSMGRVRGLFDKKRGRVTWFDSRPGNWQPLSKWRRGADRFVKRSRPALMERPVMFELTQSQRDAVRRFLPASDLR